MLFFLLVVLFLCIGSQFVGGRLHNNDITSNYEYDVKCAWTEQQQIDWFGYSYSSLKGIPDPKRKEFIGRGGYIAFDPNIEPQAVHNQYKTFIVKYLTGVENGCGTSSERFDELENESKQSLQLFTTINSTTYGRPPHQRTVDTRLHKIWRGWHQAAATFTEPMRNVNKDNYYDKTLSQSNIKKMIEKGDIKHLGDSSKESYFNDLNELTSIGTKSSMQRIINTNGVFNIHDNGWCYRLQTTKSSRVRETMSSEHFDFCNQLLFDFTNNGMDESDVMILDENIEFYDQNEKTDDNPCNQCVRLRNYGDLFSDYIFPKLEFNIVRIDNMLSNHLNDMSFNHAGCQCEGPPIDVKMFVNGGYSHLKHIHIMTALTKHDTVFVWSAYNGIAAL